MGEAFVGDNAALTPQHLAALKENKRGQRNDIIATHNVVARARGGVDAHKRDDIAHREHKAVEGIIYSATSTAPRGIEVYKDKIIGRY